MTYPRGLVKGFEPFDPIEISEKTERIVIDRNKRKYNKFKLELFYGQIATARGVGCNLRCGFCWINPSRDYPENYGTFYSPQEAYDKLVEVSSNEYGRAILSSGVRVSGCEPTIGKNHLLPLIEICKKGDDFGWFLLETNGILLGHDEDYVKELSKFGDYLMVRLSFKAGTPEAFERKTGARAEYFDLQFYALENLRKHRVPYSIAAMSKDPKIMPHEERRSLFKKLAEYKENFGILEEETTDPFGITKRRLVESGLGDPSEIRKEVYEPLYESIWRALKAQRLDRKGYSELDENEIRDIFKVIEFRTEKSQCSICPNRNNPWHGHKTEHDLDDKLR